MLWEMVLSVISNFHFSYYEWSWRSFDRFKGNYPFFSELSTHILARFSIAIWLFICNTYISPRLQIFLPAYHLSFDFFFCHIKVFIFFAWRSWEFYFKKYLKSISSTVMYFEVHYSWSIFLSSISTTFSWTPFTLLSHFHSLGYFAAFPWCLLLNLQWIYFPLGPL